MINIETRGMPVSDEGYIREVLSAHDTLVKRTGAGNEFTGWLDTPAQRGEVARIKAAAEKIQGGCEALVVIGIGGSYLGARAVIDLLKGSCYNLKAKKTPNIYFSGNGLDSSSLQALAELLEGKDFSINVISKSGTTTEPAVAFRFFKNMLEARYGADGARERIYVTTDSVKGKLRELADAEGYETFSIPADVGGRYSVLTPVGLLPMAVAGIDIDAVLDGAASERNTLLIKSRENVACKYAAARNALYASSFEIEILGSYRQDFRFFAEWWKQLFGESEGKEGKGLYPASVELTADLHSMGQYIQEGRRSLFETVVRFKPSDEPIMIPISERDFDGLKYLEGKSLDFVQSQAMEGVASAHISGGVPNIIISAGPVCEKTAGELLYFFEFSCGLSGYTLKVNPFDQPGVELYKKNMFALLGKPGCVCI